MTESPIPVIGGLTLFVVMLIVGLVTIQNRFVRLENLLRESWANVDVALQRRHDLIPNLVKTVRAYAAHEESLFEKIARERETAIAALANLSSLRAAEDQLAKSISGIMMRAEAYPDLKANEQFLALQVELANTEDRIAASRRFYNGNVREYNTYIDTFPASLLAGGRTHREYFEIESVNVRAPIEVSQQIVR